jgi:hypothetical protein
MFKVSQGKEECMKGYKYKDENPSEMLCVLRCWVTHYAPCFMQGYLEQVSTDCELFALNQALNEKDGTT